jgi:hypothetical protein
MTGEGANEVTLPDGTIIPSTSLTMGTSLALASSSGRSGTRGNARGRGGATSYSHMEGTSETTSANWSRAVQTGVVPGFSESEGFSETITVTPFHELHTRYVPGHVEFFSREEQAILNIQDLKAKGTGEVFLAAPNSGEFLTFPRAFDPELTHEWRNRCLVRVDERRLKQLPSSPMHEPEPSALASVKNVTAEPLRIPDVLPEENIDEPDEYDLFR